MCRSWEAGRVTCPSVVRRTVVARQSCVGTAYGPPAAMFALQHAKVYHASKVVYNFCVLVCLQAPHSLCGLAGRQAAAASHAGLAGQHRCAGGGGGEGGEQGEGEVRCFQTWVDVDLHTKCFSMQHLLVVVAAQHMLVWSLEHSGIDVWL